MMNRLLLTGVLFSSMLVITTANGREVARDTLGGAAKGAAIGAIAGDTKKGLKIGAASGALVGGMRRSDQKRREEQNRQQWEQQEVANYSQNRNNYNRAYAACLEGRGYSVK